MTFLLLALLAVSLAMIVVGFFLSYKLRMRDDSRAAYNVARTRQRIVQTAPLPMRTRRLAETARASVRTRHLTVELAPRSAASISLATTAERLFGGRVREPKPIVVIVVGLISVFVLGLYTLSVVFPRSAMIDSIFFYGEAAPSSGNQNASANNPQFAASQALLRISQLDPAQYNSTQEYTTWAYSACSSAAMTEVINAYGHHYRVTDILKVESQIGEITPALGLLEDVGVQRTVAQFGFKTTWGYKLSIDQVISIANQGRPVIVSFPPSRYPEGHIVVVTGGNGQSVSLADSSLYNRRSITRTQFMQWWGGFSAIVTPN